MMETLDTPITPAKPLVVIKKGNIYNTSNVPILQTLIKRPNPNVSVEDNPSAKRLCPDFEKSIKQGLDIEGNNESLEDKTKAQVKNPKTTKRYVRKSNTIMARQAGGVCMRHDEPLPEHQAEGLLQPGDTFASIEEFNKYITEYAKKWFFYYVRSETRLNKPHGTCVYRCKFFRKHQRSQSTGKRAQKNMSISLSCPASVHLKRTADSEQIKVTLVCHHHTHELSKEVFEKQPHGYRLPQEIKDEIKDLALLNVHPALIRKYVESKVPDLNFGKTVINTVISLRRRGITKDILSAQRITEMLEKIRYIKANFDISATTRSRRKRAPKYLDIPTAKTSSKRKAVRKSKPGLESDSESMIDDPPEVVLLSEGGADLDTVENDTEYEEFYTYVEDEALDMSYEVDEDDDNKQIRLINPTTGTFDDPEPVPTKSVDSDEHLLLVNAETGLLDVVPKIEPIEEPEQTVLLRKYKIGDISIECAESVDESGNATVTLNQIKAKGGLTESNVLSQLSKLEKSINEPIDYSMKTRKKKGGRQKKLDKDPVMEAKMKCQIRHDKLPEQQAEGLVQVSFELKMPRCSIVQCGATKGLNQGDLSLHLFPTNDFMKRKWMKVIGEENIRPSCHHRPYICSIHFEEKYIRRTLQRVRLCYNAVPSPCFLPQRSSRAEVLGNAAQSFESSPSAHLSTSTHVVGSTFSSIEELLSYVASQAPKWFFYYHVFDSRNTKASPKYDRTKSILYNLNCRFNKGFYKSKSKGLRKVKRKSILCPAAINVKCLPGEDKFTVTYVCHHHSHELSAELFGQEAHGHRLPQELKEEIRVLAWFKLDSALIKLYLEDLTGLKMGKTVKNIVAMMKKKQLKVDVPPEKMKEILEKIKDIKQRFQVPKRGPAIRKSKIEAKQDDRSDSDKEEVENKSRVETRLHNIQFDQELIQSVRELQENTGCEIEINSWGGVNVITDGVNLQEGLEIKGETHDNEPTECQIKIDQEVYNMDDAVQYIIPPHPEGSNIFGVEFAGVGDRIVYIQETDETVPEVDTGLQYDNTVTHEEIQEDQVINDNATKVLNIVECSEDVYDKAESNEDALADENDHITEGYQNELIPEEYHQVTYITDQNICVDPEIYTQASQECTDNENEYQSVYQYTSDDKEIYYRDVGVQADLEIIQLEGEYERISKLESAVVHDNTEDTIYSYNSRSQPKYIVEEAIINRYNIEFYINHCSVGTCLENLAGCMGISVITLLKQLYRGEAVFKITSGRAGNQNRKTVNVAYYPLTIAFPYEKFKYINHLQEYRTICSKYSDVTMQLETTVETISKALEAKTLELDEFISRNKDQGKLILNYEDMLKKNTLLEESLQKTQTELAEMKKLNNTLTKKITHLEQLNISSRIKDAEILKQLLTPTPKQENSKAIKENKILKHKIQELSEERLERSEEINEKLIERIKALEGSLNLVNAENINYKSKARKLVQLYFTDNQSLLDKIKALEAQIQQYKEESDDNFAENQNSLKLLTFAETKCRKLEKQVKELQALQTSDKNTEVGKNNLEEAHPNRGCITRSRQKN